MHACSHEGIEALLLIRGLVYSGERRELEQLAGLRRKAGAVTHRSGSDTCPLRSPAARCGFRGLVFCLVSVRRRIDLITHVVSCREDGVTLSIVFALGKAENRAEKIVRKTASRGK